MTPRPAPNSDYPYTQGDVVTLTGASMPQVKKLATKLLNKRAGGTGNYLGFSLDDALRIAVARELLRLGVQVGSMHGLFASIEKDWPKLRSPRVYVEGATLVLRLNPFGPAGVAHCFLTTAIQAVAMLKGGNPKQTVVVIDVGALINQLEERTGKRYVSDE